MNTLLKVARYHLMNKVGYIIVPWSVVAFTFVVNLIIFSAITTPVGDAHTGSIASIYIILFILGVQSVVQSLPFGFALGLSRRSYYLGTVTLVVGVALAYGVILTLLQELERATGGWGLHMSYFRVAFILSGSWYQTLLTSFIGLVLFFVWGMWFGLIHRRWNLPGLLIFVAAQITVLLIAALAVTWAHDWSGFVHFFRTVSAVGLTGIMAALAALLLAGGFGTIRRVTV